MLEFLRAMKRDHAFLTRLPSMIVSFGVAEVFYKFHSFALECLAFLGTWFAFDVIVDLLLGKRDQQRRATPVHLEARQGG